MENLKKKCSKIVAGVAMKITSNTVNSACLYFMHQPRLPEGAERLRRK